ncbi:MAG: DinB family protein [Candidatus Acidiferrales bacterium]
MQAARAEELPGIVVLEQAPIIIEKILIGATEEQMFWKPSMERWSIREVMGHLADVEISGFRQRVQMMVERDAPFLESYDQNASYAAGKYSNEKPREYLKQFCHERDRSLSFLRYIPATAASRTGMHAEHGKTTVGELMNEWAFHDLGHIRQIAELLRSRAFYPRMGAFQKYYKISP